MAFCGRIYHELNIESALLLYVFSFITGEHEESIAEILAIATFLQRFDRHKRCRIPGPEDAVSAD